MVVRDRDAYTPSHKRTYESQRKTNHKIRLGLEAGYHPTKEDTINARCSRLDVLQDTLAKYV